ncbi:hypothetical protein V2A60_004953 [Cordyceps javanica]
MDHHSLAARGDSPAIFSVAPSSPPFATPSLTANLVARVALAVVANVVCLVPLRNLYLNGEFAAAVFIVVVEIKNVFTILMALLWRTDDMASWWPGYGLCDLEPFVYNGCAGIFVTCLLAIMRNLAHQVGIMRANPLTVREKRRRNLVQALIIFPLPVVQLALTWPLAARRYAVGTLMGCSWVPASSWPYLLFFVVAQLVVSVVAAIYAVITFFRFRQVSKTTSSALSSNRAALLRGQRTKRRLYLMVTSILVPFLPINVTLCVLNVQALSGMVPFNVNQIHHPTSPDQPPWGAILFLPSSAISFGSLNNGYISIITAIPIFIFFGMTKDAMNSYRVILLRLGLGRIWPSLHNEYDPDRKAMQTAAATGYLARSSKRTKSSQNSSQYRLTTHATSKSVSSGESTAGSVHHDLSRVLTPGLAAALGGGPSNGGGGAPIPPHPRSWTSRLPRSPFPFRNKSEAIHLAPAIPPQTPTPVLPPLDTKASALSLRSQDDDAICPQAVPPRRKMSSSSARNFSLPVMGPGRPHPSEALDLPGALSTLESGNRSVRFANHTLDDAGDNCQ